MTNRKTKKKPAKRTGRRETSARVARIAGRLLRLAEKGRFTVMTEERQSDGSTDVIVHGVDKEVRALCGSALVQREPKGRVRK